MKKWIAMLCALFLVCFATVSFAAEIVRPNTSETFRALVGGKSFTARISGLESTGEDEDAKFRISVTVCERDQFDAAVIDHLAAGDILTFGDGTATMVREVLSDEYGITVKGGISDVYCFSKNEDGYYTACTETDYPFWSEIFTISVPLEKDISFLDWSDPENLDEPVKLGFDELLDYLLEGTNFSPNNTQVTFDGNGKLVEFLYTYSPWN